MERRHTLTRSSFWAQPRRWNLRQVLPWLCLLVIVSTTTYGLQVAAASIMPSSQVGESYQIADGHDIREQRVAFPQAVFTPAARVVLITGHHATTGERMRVECVTTTDRYAEDALLVDLKDFFQVAAQLCTVADAPAVRP